MYWPIGAPRIYNAANIQSRSQLVDRAGLGIEPIVVQTDDIPDTSTIASTVDNDGNSVVELEAEVESGLQNVEDRGGEGLSGGEDLIGNANDKPEGTIAGEPTAKNGESGRRRNSSLKETNGAQSGRRRHSSLKEDEHDQSSHRSPESKRGSAASILEENGHNHEKRHQDNERILAVQVSRSGRVFATITSNTLAIWQTKPTAVLATVVRPSTSIDVYGANVALLLRPDSAIIVVQTSLGYLITYSLATDPNSRVYKLHRLNVGGGSSRRQSVSGYTGYHHGDRQQRLEEGGGIMEVSLRFRMVIKIDAGISKALALDDELVVATSKPAAVQCIRWTPDSNGTQTTTELLSRMQWFTRKTRIIDMLHDRPMNLSTWIASDGKAYAVQKMPNSSQDPGAPKKVFRGYCFHTPASKDEYAVKAAINARFSLIAVGCSNGSVIVYNARDYVGNIPVSHKLQLPVSLASSGPMTFLAYSPDGYCLFAGFERGWMMWSVYGKPAGSSFASDRSLSETNEEEWLTGVRDGCWITGGSAILLLGAEASNLLVLEMARSALTTLFSSANISHSLLLTDTGLMVYRGHNMPDLTAISAESSVWHNVQIPSDYIVNQWPIRCAVASPDGRYVAVAGRRGLAHYSVHSGRWKTFYDPAMEDEFIVRGGMCWHQHVLIAAVETGMYFQLRLYSRELALDNSLILYTESIPAPIVLIARSGEDSLLVYTYENILYHYIITASTDSIQLVQVGQIALHGIIRAPARVRAVSWLLPETQIQDGDPSQDVKVATVLFLVDGKLVLLRPSTTEEGGLKYDMRVIAQNIEYYALMRDHHSLFRDEDSAVGGLQTPVLEKSYSDFDIDLGSEHDLRDSLWMFDGDCIKVWPDVKQVLQSTVSGATSTIAGAAEPARDRESLPPTVSISFDFYPLSVVLERGVIIGLEADLVQRRDIGFAFFRIAIRTHLFIPPLLRHILTHPHPDSDSNSFISSPTTSSTSPNPNSGLGLGFNPASSPNPLSPNPSLSTSTPAITSTIPAALHMASFFQHLPYFSHALEMLLHNVLDDEVDQPPASPDTALLPVVILFLSNFATSPSYLDIIVQCTRKTEVRSWRTLFQYLPPPQDLFEESLAKNALKTAGGYLLVLHTLEEISASSHQLIRLLRRAVDEEDWDLCKELARFLTALDGSGATLRQALDSVLGGGRDGAGVGGEPGENGGRGGAGLLFKNTLLSPVPPTPTAGLRISRSTSPIGLGIGNAPGGSGSSSSDSREEPNRQSVAVAEDPSPKHEIQRGPERDPGDPGDQGDYFFSGVD